MTVNWKAIREGAVLVAALSLVFAVFSVYNTGRLPFLERLGFWGATMVTGAVSTGLVAPWIRNGPGRAWPRPVQALAIAALISIPITLLLQGLSTLSGYSLPAWRWGVQYGYVFLVAIVVTAISLLLDHSRGGAETAAKDAAEAFLERLPVKYRGAALHAVSSEDHYLRVHTDRGEELILMRLADAVRELTGAEGLQTHRSWWVAAGGVADARRENGKLVLVLKSGAEAPVSRSYAKAVKEAGLV